MKDDQFILTVEQIEMSLKALGWTFDDLSEKTGLHRNTINNAINDEVAAKSLRRIRKALEGAGLEILEPGQKSGVAGSGVRWRDKNR